MPLGKAYATFTVTITNLAESPQHYMELFLNFLQLPFPIYS